MAEPTLKDKTYSIIMKGLWRRGRRHTTREIAEELGVSPREGKASASSALLGRGFAGWLFPKGDTVVSFAPFNNLPTQYRITVDGEQKWFAQ